MTTTIERDYSLIGRDTERALEQGLVAAEWYHTDVPRKRMKALMRRRNGPAIRDTIDLVRSAGGVRRRRGSALGQLVVCPVLCRLRRPVRLGVRFALARVRPRHGVPDDVAQRRALPGRVVHEHEGADALALEPRPPSHRHDHRRARPRDPGDAPAGCGAARRSTCSASAMPSTSCVSVLRHAVRPAHRGGGDVHPGLRAPPGRA